MTACASRAKCQAGGGPLERRVRRRLLEWQPPLTGRRVTGDANLVALSVAEVGTEVVGVVLRAQARRAFGSASVGQCHLIRAKNDLSALGQERDHLTIACLVFLVVVGSPDEEKGPRTWV